MNVAFTICSANYLPFAKTVADSVVKHNPDYNFVIALADTYRRYDPAFFAPHTIIPVTNMQIPSLAEMNSRYDIFELSCALKPFVADYLFHSLTDCETLFYFDTDILLYHSLAAAEAALEAHPIVLTPHLQTAKPFDAAALVEQDVLRTGLYNAGFFGLKKGPEVLAFLAWWKERLVYLCYNKATDGLFVDQFWLNFVPLYFRNSFVLFHPGYNLAYWNFHERTLTKKEGQYFVNDSYPLVFLHFSGFDVLKPEKLSRHQRDSSLSWSQYLPLFREYASLVVGNNGANLFAVAPGMGRLAQQEQTSKMKSLVQKIKRVFKKK